MKKYFAVGVGLLVVWHGAQAQAENKTQDKSLPLWELGVAAGVASTPAYPASSDRTTRALVLPFGFYRGKVIRADRSGVSARMAHTDDYEFDIGFSGAMPASSNDVAVRKDMPDLGTLAEFGPRLKLTLARPTAGSQVRLVLPVRSVLEINNGMRGQGASFEPELSYETRDGLPGWGFSVSGSLLVGDSQLNQYFYGVPAAYATPIRPSYDAQAGLISSRLGFTASTSVNKEVRVMGFVRFDSYRGSANASSPLYVQSSGTSVGFLLTWILSHSEARAQD